MFGAKNVHTAGFTGKLMGAHSPLIWFAGKLVGNPFGKKSNWGPTKSAKQSEPERSTGTLANAAASAAACTGS
jgi:hypothetical protein